MRYRATSAALAVLLVSALAAPLAAQEDRASVAAEVELLRSAAALEQVGDLAGAEAAYRRILESRPASLSALISLERILRVENRVVELLPVLDAHLAAVPESPIGHQTRLRIHADLDQKDLFARAADAWLEAVPHLETPYREIARQLEQQGLPLEALAVLRRGSARIDTPDALALEIGAIHATLGSVPEAVDAWQRAIGPEAAGFPPVERRLTRLPDGGARVIPPLVDALTAAPISIGRQRAAAQLALRAGLGETAEPIVAAVAGALSGLERQGFLIEVARRAEAARLPRMAYWAYGELLVGEPTEVQPAAVRTRVAELALLLGDTTHARSALEMLGAGATAGSIEQRRAAAAAVELAIRSEPIEAAERRLETFRARYPEAAEGGELAATLAERHLAAGDAVKAAELLRGAGSSRAGVLRARLALRGGEVRTARLELMGAAEGLDAEAATAALTLARLLGSLGPAAGTLLGEALDRRDAGAAGDAVVLLVGRSAALPETERAALLGYAAGLADEGGLAAEAEQIRRTLVLEHPDAPETPPALLALARALAQRPSGVAEARVLLERLVLEYPTSALVPQARRELDRLKRTSQ